MRSSKLYVKMISSLPTPLKKETISPIFSDKVAAEKKSVRLWKPFTNTIKPHKERSDAYLSDMTAVRLLVGKPEHRQKSCPPQAAAPRKVCR